MGITGADFGAVPTDGLVRRVRKKVADMKEATATARFTSAAAKNRRIQQLDTALASMETEYAMVGSGIKPEGPFREKLIMALDPRLSGGTKRARFKW